MANITITAGNVLPSTGAVIVQGTFGESVTQGQVVYKSATDGKWYLAQCDDAANDDAVGIALCAGGNGQPGLIQTRGNITIGGTVAVGQVYAVSATAGAIAPWSDLEATNYVTIVGVGISASVIQMNLLTTGVQIPS